MPSGPKLKAFMDSMAGSPKVKLAVRSTVSVVLYKLAEMATKAKANTRREWNSFFMFMLFPLK